jgi:hypothetical protein
MSKLPLPNTNNILSNILLSRLPPSAEGITGDHEYGFDAAGSIFIEMEQSVPKRWHL